jgi:Zn-dependent M16 (insulinase) family peptidase
MGSSSIFKMHASFGEFYIFKITPIHELQATFYEIIHKPSGAVIYHIKTEDAENVFCLAFKTPPEDSTGVAHIVEHTVLCGSKKYPVKDPFFAMTRRSLNTFMNALTGADYTCYPAASMIEKDFYNLLEVYIDAVFHPILNPLSFAQEGCRVELEQPKDPSSPLVYKGIVFNEMKGAMASSDARLWHLVNETLTPDLPYCFNSGGDPKEIPKLTYEQFKKFYEKCYHPAECLYYFYGNLPLDKHLIFLQKHIFDHCKGQKKPEVFYTQKRFTQPKHVDGFYPLSNGSLKNKASIAFSFLTASIKDQEDILALELLESILLEHDASLLKHALLKTGLCHQVDTLLDNESSEVPFHILCKGTEKEHADRLKKVLFSTLASCIEKGFEKETILASLHQLEFSATEISSDYFPFGLTLFFRSGLAKFYGCEPTPSLLMHSQFEKLLKNTEDPNYLPSLIKKYFLNNPHFVVTTLSADDKLASHELLIEKQELNDLKQQLSSQQLAQMAALTTELALFQNKQEHQELECLPELSLEDVPKTNHQYVLTHKDYSCFSVFHHDCFTNHILYIDLVSSLPELTEEELLYTRLFTYLFSEVGTEQLPYEENLDRLHLYTGGIGCALGIHSQCNTPDIIKPAIHIRGKCLHRNSKKLFELTYDMLQYVSFKEKERIKEVILDRFTHLEQKYRKGSLNYAIDLAVCHNSIPTQLFHLWHGLGFYKFLENLAHDLDNQLATIMEKLSSLKKKLFHNNHLDVVITCAKEHYTILEDNHFFGLSHLNKHPYLPWKNHFRILKTPSLIQTISSPVAFTCMGFKTIYAPDPSSPYLSLASTLMQHKTVHQAIREIGGAYGASCSYNIINGNFLMTAYRDPHLISTIDAFYAAINLVFSGHFSEKELQQAKMSLIQNLDAPLSPGARGTDSYTHQRENLRPQLRQQYREAILNAGKHDVIEATKRHLIEASKHAKVVSFCGEALASKEKGLLKEKYPHLF